METSQLNSILEQYERAIEAIQELKASNSTIKLEPIIELLNTRNNLQIALNQIKQVPTIYLQWIIKLDDKLRELAPEITKVIQTDRWAKLRSSVNPTNDAWWWKLETTAPPHKWDRFDWLWKGLTVALWTGNLSLLFNIASRFLSVGAGFWGASAVILPSILTLLQASSELTKTGKAGFDKLLTKLKIPLHFHEEAKFVSTLMMSASLYILWSSLPLFSQIYKANGLIDYSLGKLGDAEQNYLQAISLNQENLDAHFSLGNVYEDLQELDKAKKHYLIAVRGNIPDAYNNLAHLYIKTDKNKQYPEAAALLIKGLDLAQEQNSNPEVKYSLFKNLGWVRFKQVRNQEAQKSLKDAINLATNKNYTKYIRNRASAHCILGQVLEQGDKQPTAALQQWQKCCELADKTNPHEDTWLYKARQKLKIAGKVCKNMTDSQN